MKTRRGRMSGDGINTVGSKAYYQRRNKELIAENTALKQSMLAAPPAATLAKMNTTRSGHVAQQLARYRIARAGLQFFIPEEQQAACDLLVRGNSGRYYRCEVKSTKSTLVKLTTSKYDRNTKTNRTVHYVKDDQIDFFIIVDLVTEIVCVVPFDVLENATTVTVNPDGKVWKFKDRFDLLA